MSGRRREGAVAGILTEADELGPLSSALAAGRPNQREARHIPAWMLQARGVAPLLGHSLARF
jgi:hypothetical protein